jgi:hypothetical protein
MSRAVPLLAVLILAAGGCNPTSIAKQGFKELKGASGKVLPIQRPTGSDLQTYKSVRLNQVTNEIGRLCPPTLLSALKVAIPQALSEIADEYPGGEPVLSIDIAVQYAQTGGGIGAALGKDQYLISRVYLRDPDTNPVGQLVLVAHSEAMRTTEQDLAVAAAKKLAHYLKSTKAKPK